MEEVLASEAGCPGLREGRPVSLGRETWVRMNSVTSYTETLGGTLRLGFLLCDVVGMVSAGVGRRQGEEL